MFESLSPAEWVVPVVGVTVAFFALDFWRRAADAAEAVGVRGSRVGTGIVLGAWAGFTLLATFLPVPGNALTSIPALSLLLYAGVLLILASAGFAPAFRHAFDSVPMPSLMTFFYWRAVFGALLLAGYAAGRLPAGFGIPVGLGDMAVTMLAVLVLASRSRSGEVSRTAVWIWNTVGLFDLVMSVPFLAVTVLRPWAAQRGLPGANFALQLFAVPLFVGLHLHIFGRLWREAKSPQRSLAAGEAGARKVAMIGG